MRTSLYQKSRPTVTSGQDRTSITPFEEMGNPFLEVSRSCFFGPREIKDESVSFEEMKVEDWIKRNTDSLLMRGMYASTWEQGNSPTTISNRAPGINGKVSNIVVDAQQ